MEMKSSSSPLALHIHHPVSAGWVNTPEESIWRSMQLGLHYGVQPFYTPMWFVQKYTLLQVLIDSDCFKSSR